jgi:hypothetical protein
MPEIFIFLLIFIGIIVVSSLVFGGWFIVTVVRGLATFLGLRSAELPGARRPSGAIQTGPPANQRLCPYELCKSTNDLSARYCRRCGRELGAARPVEVRRVAAW